MVEDWVGRLRKSFGDRFGKDTELTADVQLDDAWKLVKMVKAGAAKVGGKVEYQHTSFRSLPPTPATPELDFRH
jgi:hypothetical protein